MRRNSQIYADLIVIAVLSLVPLLWFREGYNAVAGFDFAVYLDPLTTLKKSFYLWSDLMAGGYDSSHEVSSMFYYLMYAVPVMLGASLYTAEKIVFVLFFALQGFGIYYMLRVLFARHAAIRLVAFIGAVLYMFSYPVMAHYGRGNMMSILAYGLLPVLIGLLYRGFTNPEKRWRYVALIALLSFPLAAIKGHPADFVVIVGVALFFTLYHAVLAGRYGALRILAFAAMTCVAAILVNLWWIVPNIIYLRDFGLSDTDMVDEGFYNLKLLASYSSGSSILNTFRNDRLDLYFDFPGDRLLNPGLYQSTLFVAIGLLLPVLAFTATCLRKRDPNVLFLAFAGVAAVFMSKGSHDPFGGVFEYLYLNVPGFFFFRAPYRVFSSLLTFAMAPLAAITIGSMVERLGEAHKYGFPLKGLGRWPQSMSISGRSLWTIASVMVVITVVSASTLYAWPVFTGSHMKERGTRVVPGVFHVFPDEYAEAKKWVEKAFADSDGGKLYYPYQLYDINTSWGFNGPDPTHELFKAPKVVSRPGGTVYVRYQKPIERLNSTIWNWRYGDIQRVLSVYGTKYAMLHDDINPWVLSEYAFTQNMRSLFAESGLERAKTAGPLEFYENNSPLGSVYEALSGYVLSGDESAFPALSLTSFMDRPFMVMTRDLNPDELEKVLGSLNGMVFFNSNVVDAACSILEASHGRKAENKSVMFNALEMGMYVVYAKDAETSNDVVVVDGEVLTPVGKIEGVGDGFSWKKTAEMFLTPGMHTIERMGLWNKSTVEASTEIVSVMPKRLFEKVHGRIEKALDDPGFLHTYIFDDELEVSGNGAVPEVTLYGAKAYSIATMTPKWFARERTDAVKDVTWRLLSEDPRLGVESRADGSITIESKIEGQRMVGVGVKAYMDPLEAGRFPELEYTLKSSSGAVVDRSVIAHVRTDDNRLKTVLVDDVVGERKGHVEIYRKIKAALGGSGSHRLESIEWRFTVRQQRPGFDITLGRPSIYGISDHLSTGCANVDSPVLSIEGMPVAIDNKAGCAKWSTVGTVVGNGGFEVAGFGKRDRPALVMITRQNDTITALQPVGKVKATQKIEVKKISPTYRVAKTKGTSAPLMVFTDSYDKDWVMNSGGARLHPIKVNGFANGFMLAEKVLPGALKGAAYDSSQGDNSTRMKRASFTAVEGDGGAVEQGAGVVEGIEDFTLSYGPQKAYRYSAIASVVAFGAVAFAGWRNG